MNYLILIRHAESTWNEIDAWTGLTDIGLSKKGFDESKKDLETQTEANTKLLADLNS